MKNFLLELISLLLFWETNTIPCEKLPRNCTTHFSEQLKHALTRIERGVGGFSGGYVMVWCCFGGGKVVDFFQGNRCLEEGKHRTMAQNTSPSQNHLGKKQWAGILCMVRWPPQSQDLSPAELLWEQLDRPACDSGSFRKPEVKSLKVAPTNWQLERLKSARL